MKKVSSGDDNRSKNTVVFTLDPGFEQQLGEIASGRLPKSKIQRERPCAQAKSDATAYNFYQLFTAKEPSSADMIKYRELKSCATKPFNPVSKP